MNQPLPIKLHWCLTRWHYRNWSPARRKALFATAKRSLGRHNIYTTCARDWRVLRPRNASRGDS